MVGAPGPTRENQRLCTLLSLGVHTDGYTTVTRRENQRVVHAARKACTTTASSGTWVAAGGGTRQLVAARGSWAARGRRALQEGEDGANREGVCARVGVQLELVWR